MFHRSLSFLFVLTVVCSASGCDWLDSLFENQPPSRPAAGPPTPVFRPALQPEVKVDRSAIEAIEKRDNAIGVVKSFEGALPTQRTDQLLQSLAEVPDELFTIRDVDVAASRVTDNGLRQVAKMPRVESLDVSHLNFTEEALVDLHELPNLRKLTALKAQFPGNACLHAIGQLSHLEELTLSETNILDADLAGLRGMPNLRIVHLDATRLTDAAFEHLATLQQLEVLTVSQTNISSRGLQRLCGVANSRLRVLDVHLTFAGHNGFGNLDGLRSLEELDASQSQVTDQSLRGWVSPPNLKKLNLSGNAFNNASLPAILNSPVLEELDLQKISGINDPGLNHIVKKKSLRFVQLDQTGVSLQSAQQLKQMMPGTRIGIAGTIY